MLIPDFIYIYIYIFFFFGTKSSCICTKIQCDVTVNKNEVVAISRKLEKMCNFIMGKGGERERE